MSIFKKHGLFSMGLTFAVSLTGSGCVEEYSFESLSQSLPPPNSDLCAMNPEAAACKRDPVVSTPGVVSVLFTVSQIPQGAASLILANAIKYASPVANPKILFLKDTATNGEDEGDSDYIKNTLLLGYSVDYQVIASGGLNPSETQGYDLVIVSNPGHPLTDVRTLNTLNVFSGGVILVGDDLAHGSNFSMDAFTGMAYRNNGTSMSCNGKSYGYDNGNGYNYQISMNSEFLPGIPDAMKNYEYGNDIDWATPASGTQVLAWASAAPGTCDIGQVPAVVRRPK